MDSKRNAVIAGLISAIFFMIAAAPVQGQNEQMTVMLPGDVPLVMVRIPAGTFLMGSPEGERGNVFDNETQHQVTLTQDYYLGKTEMTQGQWEAVMGTAMPMSCGDFGLGDEFPLYCVTWAEFAGPGGFIERLNQQQGTTMFRLPTEAEWERAARADTTTRFSHGDVLECDDDCGECAVHDEFMWWCGNSTDTAMPVGQKQPNPFGLHDMHGSLWEWVQDRYGEFSTDPATDPTGPESGNDRVIRGGDWSGEANFSRSASRVAGSPVIVQGSGAGFRLAATASAATTFDDLSFVPAVAVAGGSQGSFFESDLELNNAAPTDGNAAEMDVQYKFWWLPRGEDNSDPMVSETFSLGAGQSVRIENVLTEIFGLEPNELGALAIAASSPYLIGMSRTYNIPAGDVAGTYGQALPAVPEAELIQAGDTKRIIFMSENADFRANLGCVNGTDTAIQVLIELFDAAGTPLETRTMALGPWSNKQINQIFSSFQPVNGYVDVWSETDGALFYCYGSVLDNATSDPTTILPQ